MWVVYVEAALAVLMLLFVVWWTWPEKSAKPGSGEPVAAGERKEDKPPPG